MEQKPTGIWGIAFLLGAVTLIQQTLLLREFLVIVQGNELSIGICLGNWLLGIFLGSIVGSRMAERLRDMRVTLAAIFGLMGILSPAQILFVRLIGSIHHTPIGAYLPMEKAFLFSSLTLLPFAFLVGFLFPIFSRLAAGDHDKKPENVARLYAMEALGSLAGGALYSFLLAGQFPSLHLSFAGPILISFVLAALCWKWRKPAPMFFHIGFTLIGALCLLTGIVGRFENRSSLIRWQGISEGERIESRDTRYQNLQLGKSGSQYSLYSNGQLAVSFPSEEENRLLALHLLCQHPRPRRILIIGEAVSGLAQRLLDTPLENLTVVELDPTVPDMIRRHLGMDDRKALFDPRLQILIADGRRAMIEMGRLRNSTDPFDILFLHIPEPSTALINRLYTREFFLAVSRVLSLQGVVTIPLLLSENYASGEMNRLNASFYQTVKSVFPYTGMSPGPIPLLFASRDAKSVSMDPRILAERFERLQVKPQRLGKLFPYLYPAERTMTLLTAFARPPALLNRDDRPRSYYLFSKIFGLYSNSRWTPLLSLLEGVRPEKLWPLLFFPLFIHLFRSRKLALRGLHPSPPALFCAAIAGFSGLSLEIVVIYWLQNRCGYVYQMVGWIAALFMLGLAAGAMAVIYRQRRPGPTGDENFLMGANALLALLSLLLGIAFRSDTFPVVGIFGFNFLIGCVSGAIFSILLRLRSRGETSIGRKAGKLNASDNLGAAAGAWLTSAFMLPLFGIRSLSLLIAALAGLVVVMTAISRIYSIKQKAKSVNEI